MKFQVLFRRDLFIEVLSVAHPPRLTLRLGFQFRHVKRRAACSVVGAHVPYGKRQAAPHRQVRSFTSGQPHRGAETRSALPPGDRLLGSGLRPQKRPCPARFHIR